MDWTLTRIGHRTWRWRARCGHSGTGSSKARLAAAALRHVAECEHLREMAAVRG